MKSKWILASLLLTQASCALSMPRGSFLKTPALNNAALVKALSDPSTLAVYQQATGLSRATLIAKFKTLRQSYVRRPTVMGVYFVTKSRKSAYWRLRMLRPGTAVWSTPEGQLFLVQVCGNPLREAPGPIPPGVYVPPFPEVADTPPFGLPPSDIPPGVPDVFPPELDFPPVESVLPTPELAMPGFTDIPALGEIPLGPFPTGAFSLEGLAWLPLVGVVAANGSHGSSGGGTHSKPTFPIIPPHTPPVTPEPDSLLTTGLGIVMLGGACWRLRRRSTLSLSDTARTSN